MLKLFHSFFIALFLIVRKPLNDTQRKTALNFAAAVDQGSTSNGDEEAIKAAPASGKPAVPAKRKKSAIKENEQMNFGNVCLC